MNCIKKLNFNKKEAIREQKNNNQGTNKHNSFKKLHITKQYILLDKIISLFISYNINTFNFIR